MKKLFCVLFIFGCSSFAPGQDVPTDEPGKIVNRQILKLPPPAPFKPKISLQKALKLMEKFVAGQKIDTSRYYFSEARLIYYPAANERKEPTWFFAWMNDRGALSDYIHILVSMDGKVWQVPTM